MSLRLVVAPIFNPFFCSVIAFSRGTAVLMATHNYELVRKFKARIVQLKDGKLHEVELKEKPSK